MLLDFVLARWMMIVAGLILMGGAAGLYEVFTGVPERINLDHFAEEWAAPILDAFKGTGSLGSNGDGRRIEFTSVDTVNIARPADYRGKTFMALIYRDAVLLQFDEGYRRIELPGPARTHLWYATNANTYDDEEQSRLDEIVGQPMLVDFTQDILIQRAPNTTGVQQVYIYQRYAQVAPPLCMRIEAPGLAPKATCADGAIFRMLDSRGQPVYLDFDVDYDDAELSVSVVATDPEDDPQAQFDGVYFIDGEPTPVGDPGVRSLYVVSPDQMGAALRVDYRKVT